MQKYQKRYFRSMGKQSCSKEGIFKTKCAQKDDCYTGTAELSLIKKKKKKRRNDMK